MKTFDHVIQDPLGLHARPAGLLAKAAAAYQCAIQVKAPKGEADCKRLMAIMRMAAKAGDTLSFTCDGPDEDAAVAGLQDFLKENL